MSTTIEGELTKIDLLALEFPDVPYLTLAELLHNYDNFYNHTQATDKQEKSTLREIIPELIDLWETFRLVNDVLDPEVERDPYNSPARTRFDNMDELVRVLLQDSCPDQEIIARLDQSDKLFAKRNGEIWPEHHIVELVWRLRFFHGINFILCSNWYERAKWSTSDNPRYPLTLIEIKPRKPKRAKNSTKPPKVEYIYYDD